MTLCYYFNRSSRPVKRIIVTDKTTRLCFLLALYFCFPFELAAQTTSLPSPPSNLIAVSTSEGRIQLYWTASPSSETSHYNVYYDNGSGIVDYSYPLDFTNSSYTWISEPLTNGVYYTLAVRAETILGTEEKNTDVTASSLSDSEPPKIGHTPITGSFLEGSTITVSVMLADNQALAPSLLFYRSVESSEFIAANLNKKGSKKSKSKKHWGEISGGDVLTPAVEYYLYAQDTAGNSAKTAVYTIAVSSIIASTVTVAGDSTPPASFITSPSTSGVLDANGNLGGTASDEGETGVFVVEVSILDILTNEYWGGFDWAPGAKWLLASGTDTWMYTGVPSWVPFRNYRIRSKATDVEGNIENPEQEVAFTYDPPPTQVDDLSLQAPAEGRSLALTWGANAEPDIVYYAVYRDGVHITTVSAAGFQDAGLTDGTTYTYRVSAVDALPQEGEKSLPIQGIPQDSLPPEPVGTLAAKVLSSQVQLDWINPASEDVAEYRIYSDSGTGTIDYAQPIQTVPHPQKSWLTWPLSDGEYLFAVRAVDAAGNEESNTDVLVPIVVDTIPPSPPEKLSFAETPFLSINGIAEPESLLRAYADGIFIGSATANSGGGFSVLPASPLADGKYGITLTAEDDAGNVSAASAELLVTIHNQFSDLALAATNIRFSDENPVINQLVNIFVDIQNPGTQDVGSFEVAVYDKDVLVGTQTVEKVLAGQSAVATVTWLVDAEGLHGIRVIVDPADHIPESREDNNQGSRSLLVGASLAPLDDLIVVEAGFDTAQSSPQTYAGFPVHIAGRAYYNPAYTIGEPVAGGTVRLEIGDKVAEGVTNSEGNFSLSFHAPASSGSYAVAAVASDGFVEGRSSGIALEVLAIEGVDLLVSASDIRFSTMRHVQHVLETIYVDVRNSGAASLEAPVLVRFFDEKVLIAERTIPALPAGSVHSVSLDYSFPTWGGHKISVSVDPLNTVAEFSEENNIAEVSLWVKPSEEDITPQDIIVSPAVPIAGSSVEIKAVILNLGAQDVQNLEVVFFVGESEVAKKIVDIPAFGEIHTPTFTHVFPNAVDSVRIKVQADPQNQFLEASEDNNSYYEDLRVQQETETGSAMGDGGGSSGGSLNTKPNLIPMKMLFSDEKPYHDQQIDIRVEIWNSGLGAAENFKAQFFHDDVPLGDLHVLDSLMPETTIVLHQPYAAVTGTHTLKIVLDPENLVSETGENDNQLERILFVYPEPLAQLRVKSEYLHFLDAAGVDLTEIHAGQQVSLAAAVENTAEADLSAKNVPVSFYADNDLLGIVNVPTIAVGAASTATIQYGVPLGTPYKIIRIVVDEANTIAEYDLKDNAASRLMVISTAPIASPLAGLSGSALGTSSIAWTWDSSGPSALYHVFSSSAGTLLAIVDQTTFIQAGLPSNTAYGIQVEPFTDAGSGGLSPSATTFTLAAPPALLTVDGITNGNATLNWDTAGNPAGTPYELSLSTDGFLTHFSTPVIFGDALSVASTTLSDLDVGTTYYLRIRARNGELLATAFSNIVIIHPTAGNPASWAKLKTPGNGKKISGNAITLLAATMEKVRAVLFQYKPAEDKEWHDISLQDKKPPFAVYWNVSALETGDYEIRTVGYDSDGAPDPTPEVVRTIVVDINADIVEDGNPSVDPNRPHRKKKRLLSGEDNTIWIANGTRLTIYAGTLDGSTVTVTVVNNPLVAPPVPNGTAASGVVAEISLSNGQSQLLSGKKAAFTLRYPDSDDDGIVDGTRIRAEQLQMYSSESPTGPWKKDLASSVDLTNRTVTGNTSHFSFFALFSPAAADLSMVRVYPVPFMPNSGHSDDGVAFSPGNANSGMIFDNLTASVNIKIYTITGQLVARFGSNNSGGRLQWDVKNLNGQNVASGGYLTVISSPGDSNVVKKLLIVR